MKKQEDRPIIMVDVQEEFDRLLAHKYRLIGYLDDMVSGEMTPLRMKSISDRKSQMRDMDHGPLLNWTTVYKKWTTVHKYCSNLEQTNIECLK